MRVNLQGTLARHFVTPYLADFLTRYPNIQLHIGEDDRLVDLLREGIDCVLRAGPLQDSTLIAKPLAQMPQATVASPHYLKKHGTPTSIEQLAQHQAIGYNPQGSGNQTHLDFIVNEELTEVTMPASLSVNGADLYTDAARAGLGIIQVPRYRIKSELTHKQLIEILPKTRPPAMPVSALMTHTRQLSSRTRVFADWLAERFSGVDQAV